MLKAMIMALALSLVGCAHSYPADAAPRKQATKILKVDKSRLVEVIGPVNLSIIEGEARKVEKLSRKSKKPIYILLNSPGGSVAAGTSMIDAVNIAKVRGNKVVCFTGVIAASMAFNIMAYCNERYALANSKLLFHPVSLSGRGMRLAELLISAESMAKEERAMMHFLRKTLGLSWKDFHRHYFAETFWTGQGLDNYAPGFLDVVADIPGVDNLFTFTKPRPMFLFGGQKSPDQKEVERVTNPIIERMQEVTQ